MKILGLKRILRAGAVVTLTAWPVLPLDGKGEELVEALVHKDDRDWVKRTKIGDEIDLLDIANQVEYQGSGYPDEYMDGEDEEDWFDEDDNVDWLGLDDDEEE